MLNSNYTLKKLHSVVRFVEKISEIESKKRIINSMKLLISFQTVPQRSSIELYSSSGKQVIIAMDKQDSYSEKTAHL